ncbi:MAG: ATP-dependent DNA helicase RecG [Sporolactobacillus sp.]
MLEKLPVTAIKGVGTALAEHLLALNMRTVADVLTNYPYRYDNYAVKDLDEAADGESVTIVGKVQSEPFFFIYARKKSRLSVRVLSGRFLISVIAFNRLYLKGRLHIGQTVTISGKWERMRARVTAIDFQLRAPASAGERLPVYAVKSGLSVKKMRAVERAALHQFGYALIDELPETLRTAYRLISKREAIESIHFPQSDEQLKQARRRLVYDEFLIYELKMQAHRLEQRQSDRGISIPVNDERLGTFTAAFPFVLTAAQHRVLGEITADMASRAPMNRLLQGDVGSGKTAVAAAALFAAAEAGYQGALMVPTEILAEQHAAAFNEWFAPFGKCTALLTGAIRGKKRMQLLARLKDGTINVIVGTHALIQEGVVFKRLGLVITDEQHRFGVEQRRMLRVKGHDPDVLFMTATPIPRTLAIAAFGDMDISTIDELPGGRKPVKTYVVPSQMMERVIAFIRRTLTAGQQAYVVCPLIAESEQLDVQNAIDIHSRLRAALPGFSVGLMHGRLTPEEKAEVMNRFKTNRLQVLVATTVIEVGVDVPNATLMVVYDASRFGLSQLHQLRGRVGRGHHQAYCVLVDEAKSDVSREKLHMLTETTDGFKLSEFDLKLRGPGDFFGNKQSGMPEFRLGDIVHDYRTLATAERDAARLVRDPAFWNESCYQLLRDLILAAGVRRAGRFD